MTYCPSRLWTILASFGHFWHTGPEVRPLRPQKRTQTVLFAGTTYWQS